MPKVTVIQEIKGPPDAAFGKIQKYCDEKLVLRDIGNLKPKVTWKKAIRQGTFEEMGVKGTIEMKGDAPCQVVVTVDFPFFLTPLKGAIAESIQKHLAKFI